MVDERDFDQTLRNLLNTPPTPHKAKLEADDHDDLDEAHEQDASGEDSDQC